MRFRMLGPLEVRTGDDWQGIGARKWRSVLAALLLNAGQIVPTDSLVFELWGDDPPAKATNLISIYVLRLRRLIGDADGRVLITRAPGYRLSLAPGDLDAQRFEALMADGRRALAAGKSQRAADLLTEALGLWRGTALADVPPSALIEAEAERMGELRLAAMELRIEADLACGRSAQVIPELRKLVAENQIREGLWLLLMRALDESGRHAEALEVYAQAREVIADQLGVDPGVELQQLHQKILAADVPDADAAAAKTAEPLADSAIGKGGATLLRADEEPEGAPGPGIPGTIAAGTVAVSSPSPDVTAAAAAAAAPAVGELRIGPEQPRPAQLPTDIGDFTGRAGHVQHLCDILTSGAVGGPGAVPIALVAGTGGLGKTTLAVHAAHQIRAQFPDGQLYVDLLGATAQPLASGDVLARFLRDLGVDGARVPVGDDERAALYRTRLTGRRILVVLDNARDAAQVKPLLPGSASCAVLVTTRNRMYDLGSTRLVDLNVLADSEALALFTRIVGDERPEAEPDATAEVLLACAGLPLAIRICAARLAARTRWNIATMASRLRNEARRLDELKAGDLAVRASFQVSYASLQAPEAGVDPARAFRLLGLWQGPFIGLPAAAALIGQPEDDVADALEGLVDAHLLESPAPDRYRFHDLLRVYAAERVAAEESETVRRDAVRRLLGWYLNTADAAAQIVSPHRYQIPLENAGTAFPPLDLDTVEDALGWYDSERANVVAATRQASSSDLHDFAWRLPTSLFSVFLRRDNWADCVTTHRIALDSSRKVGHQQGEGWVLNNLGIALARIHDKEGIGHLEQSLAIRREIGDRTGEAQASLNLADAHFQLHGADAALEHLLRALEVLREEGPSYRHGIILNNLGETYLELGRLDEAVNSFKEARAIFTGINSANGEGYALQYLARAYLDLARRGDALDCLRQALALHRSTGDRLGEAQDLEFLGKAQQSVGQVAEAWESWTTALAIFTDLREDARVAEIQSALASLPA